MARCDTRVSLRPRRHILRIQEALLEMILRLRPGQGDRVLIALIVVPRDAGRIKHIAGFVIRLRRRIEHSHSGAPIVRESRMRPPRGNNHKYTPRSTSAAIPASGRNAGEDVPPANTESIDPDTDVVESGTTGSC